LEAFSGRAPEILRIQTALETALTAVQAQNWEKAASAYAVVAENDKNGPLGFAARLNRADLLLRQGDARAALLEWESLADQAPQELLQPLTMQIALAAEEAGEKQRAVAAYESILDSLPPASPDRAYFQSRIAALR
jgi:predicted negative regulator of RcsB-dependent stress response